MPHRLESIATKLGRAIGLCAAGSVFISTLAVVALLATGRPRGLRALSVLGVTAVVFGWGVAQYPALLPGTGLTLTTGSALHPILVTVVVVFVAAIALVIPSFLLLFSLHSRQLLEEEKPAREG